MDVFSGRLPSYAIQRLLNDAAFLDGLLGSLPGVDPAAKSVQVVVTALQGRNVAVAAQ